MIRRPPRSTLFPTRRSSDLSKVRLTVGRAYRRSVNSTTRLGGSSRSTAVNTPDRKSTRLNSSHGYISYAVFCLKKKKKNKKQQKNTQTKTQHNNTNISR